MAHEYEKCRDEAAGVAEAAGNCRWLNPWCAVASGTKREAATVMAT